MLDHTCSIGVLNILFLKGDVIIGGSHLIYMWGIMPILKFSNLGWKRYARDNHLTEYKVGYISLSASCDPIYMNDPQDVAHVHWIWTIIIL